MVVTLAHESGFYIPRVAYESENDDVLVFVSADDGGPENGSAQISTEGGEGSGYIGMHVSTDDGHVIHLSFGAEEAAQLIRSLSSALLGTRPLKDFDPEA